MAEEKEAQTTSEKLGGFIGKNKKIFIAVLIVLICALAGYIVASTLINKATVKDLQAIDEITYTLTKDSSSIDEAEIELRRQTALEQASAYVSKGGIAGARANMLCADLTYQQKKFAESADYWKACASKAKKTYLAPIAYFNLGVCCEELGNLDDAAANYKLAADNVSFVIRTHAMFSYARVIETKGDFELASKAYSELCDNFPDSEWADLAKSRLIALKVAGKIE